MYIKLTNGQPETYTIGQLRRDNPNVSFPRNIPAETLAEYDVYPVASTDQPAYNEATHKVVQGTPEIENGEWRQTWNVVPLTKEDLRRELQEQRDQALQQMQHEVEGVGVVQTRPQDIINFQTAISLGQTREWVLADNSVGTLTTEQMQECLQAGMTQGQLIWDDYIEELKLL